MLAYLMAKARNQDRDQEIRTLREKERKSQRELADMYGLSQPRISQILGNGRPPKTRKPAQV